MKGSISVIFFLIFSLVCEEIAIAREDSVMLHLSGKNQPDTLGTNLVEYLPSLIYIEIKEGRIKLWEGPSKNKQVSIVELNKIEQTTSTEFSRCNDLFLFEVWVIKKKHIIPYPLGVAFVTQNSRGEEISFGYVDYNDIKKLLHQNRIPMNANGNYGTTYEDAIMQRMFVFNMMQHNKRTFKTVVESKKVQDELLHSRKFKYNYDSGSLRQVTYSISFANSSNELSSIKAINILQAFENYFNQNIQDFLNIGGNKFYESSDLVGISLLAIEITELWTRQNKSEMTSTHLESLKFYLKSGELDGVLFQNLASYQITVGTRGVWEVIAEKKFDYRLVKINDQLVSPVESSVYLSGLKVSPWNKLLQYQRSFK